MKAEAKVVKSCANCSDTLCSMNGFDVSEPLPEDQDCWTPHAAGQDARLTVDFAPPDHGHMNLERRIVELETSLASTRSEMLEMKAWVEWKKGDENLEDIQNAILRSSIPR